MPLAAARNVICYSFSVEGVELRGPCWRNNQRNAGNCNFHNKIWYRSGPGGTELVVSKRYWWRSRTRHRVSCGTEMDRYRNGSSCDPEMVWYRTRPTPTRIGARMAPTSPGASNAACLQRQLPTAPRPSAHGICEIIQICRPNS